MLCRSTCVRVGCRHASLACSWACAHHLPAAHSPKGQALRSLIAVLYHHHSIVRATRLGMWRKLGARAQAGTLRYLVPSAYKVP